MNYEKFGWEVFPFLEVVVIQGIAFSHYFTSGVMGRPVGSANALMSKRYMSAVMGHVQTTDLCFRTRADGQQMFAMFVGLAAQHDEEYLNEVDGNGGADPMFVSLKFLARRYAS